MVLLGSMVGSRWSGQEVGHGCEGQGRHGQRDAWIPFGMGLTSGWGVAGAGRVGTSALHHEAAPPSCCSVVSPSQGRVLQPASAVAAAELVAAVAAEVKCVLHAVAVVVLAWMDAVWPGGVASGRCGVH